jgi:hypothetical protein
MFLKWAGANQHKKVEQEKSHAIALLLSQTIFPTQIYVSPRSFELPPKKPPNPDKWFQYQENL